MARKKSIRSTRSTQSSSGGNNKMTVAERKKARKQQRAENKLNESKASAAASKETTSTSQRRKRGRQDAGKTREPVTPRRSTRSSALRSAEKTKASIAQVESETSESPSESDDELEEPSESSEDDDELLGSKRPKTYKKRKIDTPAKTSTPKKAAAKKTATPKKKKTAAKSKTPAKSKPKQKVVITQKGLDFLSRNSNSTPKKSVSRKVTDKSSPRKMSQAKQRKSKSGTTTTTTTTTETAVLLQRTSMEIEQEIRDGVLPPNRLIGDLEDHNCGILYRNNGRTSKMTKKRLLMTKAFEKSPSGVYVTNNSDDTNPYLHRVKWKPAEVRNLELGMKRYGEERNKWSLILKAYNFKNRSPVDLKDKWRNLEKKKHNLSEKVIKSYVVIGDWDTDEPIKLNCANRLPGMAANKGASRGAERIVVIESESLNNRKGNPVVYEYIGEREEKETPDTEKFKDYENDTIIVPHARRVTQGKLKSPRYQDLADFMEWPSAEVTYPLRASSRKFWGKQPEWWQKENPLPESSLAKSSDYPDTASDAESLSDSSDEESGDDTEASYSDDE